MGGKLPAGSPSNASPWRFHARAEDLAWVFNELPEDRFEVFVCAGFVAGACGCDQRAAPPASYLHAKIRLDFDHRLSGRAEIEMARLIEFQLTDQPERKLVERAKGILQRDLAEREQAYLALQRQSPKRKRSKKSPRPLSSAKSAGLQNNVVAPGVNQDKEAVALSGVCQNIFTRTAHPQKASI